MSAMSIIDSSMFKIRPIRKSDISAITEIEHKCFPENPWFKKDFEKCLSHKDHAGNFDTTGMVAIHNDSVVGFIIYRYYENGYHIINIAVAVRFRRLKIGTALVQKVIEEFDSQEYVSVTLGVREKNLAAQLFFRTTGFRIFDTLRGYYEKISEDAYLMRYCIKLKHYKKDNKK